MSDDAPFAESPERPNYPPATLMANRSRNEATATARSMSRVLGLASISLCASCIAASVSAARSALDRAYLLTQAPQSLPHLPCRVARCARSCPMSLGAIAEAITQPPTNLLARILRRRRTSERGTGKLWTRLYGRKKRGSRWQPPPPVTMRRAS